ncbi:Forkhead-associated domain-containing protein 1, partial [Nipponia nippon]
MRAFLKSSEGRFQLKPHTTTIGRHEGSDIVLQSAGVAEHHAALEFTASDNSFVLQDFNSLHGTFVNGCQVQNAAVRVSPGDILRFGAGGASFELVVDGAAQVRVGAAPQGRVDGAAQGRVPRGGWAGHVPHPPPRKRPVSAWVRSVATAVPPDACSRTSAVRPGGLLPWVGTAGWTEETGTVGRGKARASCSARSMATSQYPRSRQPGVSIAGECQMAPVICPQGEKLLRLAKEIGRLSGLETESKQKDAVIRALQDEIAAMAKTLAQAAARNEVELTQKLLTFDRELGAKTEEIKVLREQISNLQKGSSQVFSHSLYERDLEIGRLRQEGEKLKRARALAAGLVTSLQREVAGKEQKIQQLEQEVEKMKKENREKDNQLAVVSAKCSRVKEETKHELGEREVMACQNRIGELERDLEGLRGEAQKSRAEQESIRNQLAEKAKVAVRLRGMRRR